MNTSTQMPPPNDLPSLDKQEIVRLFLSTLADVYNIKTHLLEYLPQLTEKASYTKLKRAILENSLEIKAQVLRIDLIYKMLNYDVNNRPESLKGTLDIKSYILQNLQNQTSYQNDFLLFAHLLMLNSIDMTYYRLLRTLAKHLQNKEVFALIKESLREVKQKRQTFEVIKNLYSA